jgi:hypothetical protein
MNVTWKTCLPALLCCAFMTGLAGCDAGVSEGPLQEAAEAEEGAGVVAEDEAEGELAD